MEYTVLGWASDGPTLRLDYRRFSYAGKFVMSNTGKAVAHEDDEDEDDPVAAVSFSPDRTDPDTLCLRYITVRQDRQGEGIGPRLARFVTERALARGFERVQIAVNNPFAYEAMYRAGFVYTGEETGIAELVLVYPPDSVTVADPTARYQSGLDVYRDRDLPEAERGFLTRREETAPPSRIESPA